MAPQRRCVGCGRVAAKSELMRLALAPTETCRVNGQTGARRGAGAADRTDVPMRSGGTATVVLDREARMPGRGAYLCRGEREGLPSEGCFVLAKRRGGVGRTLRSPAKIDWSDLVESTTR